MVEKDAAPWFVGKDVCTVLEIRDHNQALDRLDDDERGGYIVPTPSGDQSMIIISEPGVYRLVFTSRKPIAERFKRWLAHDVLPSIRKTGSYSGGPAESPAIEPDHDPKEFPNWSLEEMRTKRSMVDMFRMTHGVEAARWIMPTLGFPMPPPEILKKNRQLELPLDEIG
eukprot:gene20635-21309_t